MDNELTDWRFADDFDDCRRALLTDARLSFHVVVAFLCAGHVVCARWEWGSDADLRERVCVAFEVRASDDAVDLFHNGIDGYRARYYRSIDAGEAANAACLDALVDMLRGESHSWGLRSPAPGFPPDWNQIADSDVARSFRADGANVWISEAALRERYGPAWTPMDADETVHDLRVQRWVDAINAAAGQGGDATQFAGTRAFRVDRISVKGGFIAPGRPDQGAIVPGKKRARSQQINARGFT